MNIFKKNVDNLQLFFEDIHRYCKTELLQDRLINIPDLVTNSNKFPIYGLMPTSNAMLETIYKPEVKKRILDFTTPFDRNYEDVSDRVIKNPNVTKIISDGIRFAEDNDENVLTFPLILACFSANEEVGYIDLTKAPLIRAAMDNIHIIGHFNVTIEKDKAFQEFKEANEKSNKNLLDVNLSTQAYEKKKHIKCKIDFKLNDNFLKDKTLHIEKMPEYNFVVGGNEVEKHRKRNSNKNYKNRRNGVYVNMAKNNTRKTKHG